jgi:hypothetical protein
MKAGLLCVVVVVEALVSAAQTPKSPCTPVPTSPAVGIGYRQFQKQYPAASCRLDDIPDITATKMVKAMTCFLPKNSDKVAGFAISKSWYGFNEFQTLETMTFHFYPVLSPQYLDALKVFVVKACGDPTRAFEQYGTVLIWEQGGYRTSLSRENLSVERLR